MDGIATSKNDILLQSKLLGNISFENLPVSFKLGKKVYRGIPADFSPKIRKKFVDSNIVETVIYGKNSKGVSVRAEIYEYRDFPVVEWQVFFENTVSKSSDILSDLKAIDFTFPAKKGVLHHGNGETRNNDGFVFFDDKITKNSMTIAPNGGMSCYGAYPFMRIYTEAYTASIAIGWTGQWSADISKVDKGISYKAGQQRVNTKLYPDEVFCSPRITVMLTDGTDENRAMNMWRRWYFKHILPKEFGNNISPKSCMHVFNYKGPEFTGATTESQLEGLNKYVKEDMKPDIWWFDAGWYKCDKWTDTGTWEADRERFPVNGLAPIGEACAKNDIQFLLWFEPERVKQHTWLSDNHPEWLLSSEKDEPDGTWKRADKLLNLGNKEACDWAIEHVNKLIKDWHISIYRQDFNFGGVLDIWTANEAKDRIGAVENQHIQGYYRYWDAIVFNNPGMWIDTCAGGGRRNDLETLRRSVPLHYTDIGYGNHPIKQCQHQSQFEWVPYFRAHNMSWDNSEGNYNPAGSHPVCDEFAYQNCMVPAITVMTTAWAEESEFALGRKMLPVWRRAAEIELRADYYPITKSTKSNKELYAVEFSTADNSEGFIHVISNTLCEESGITARLHVDANARYTIENGVTGEIKTVSGASLANGFTVTLPKRSGQIWFYNKISD